MERSDDADGEGDQCGHEEARVRDERQQANTIRPGIDLNVGIWTGDRDDHVALHQCLLVLQQRNAD